MVNERDMALEQLILELEKKLLRADVRTSPEMLGSLIADDFYEFGSSGSVWTKQDLMGEDGAGEVRMTLSGFALHPLSETAMLATYRIYNALSGKHSLRSSVWTYRDERWQLFFHQGTPTAAGGEQG